MPRDDNGEAFTCPRCAATCRHPDDVKHGYCGHCHDWTRGEVTQTCPACGQPVSMRPYDIGSGPEMACPGCEWCWGVNGQPLKPIDPHLAEGIGRIVEALGPAVEPLRAIAGMSRIPPFDPRSGNHYWILPVVFHVGDPAAFRDQADGPMLMDRENLVLVTGIGCYYCEQQYTPRLAHRRCRARRE